MNIFSWGKKSSDNSKDYFSSTIYTNTRFPKIDEDKALQVATVKSAVELISNSISQLNINLYQKKSDKDILKIENELTALLNEMANNFMPASAMIREAVEDYLFYGKAYLLIRDNQLHYLEAKQMDEVKYSADGVTIAKVEYKYSGIEEVTLSEDEVIVIDSGTNGILHDSADLISTAYAVQEYNKSLLQNSAVPTGILKTGARLTEKALSNLKNSWNSLYGGSRKAGKTLILEDGLDYSPLSMNPDELQLKDLSKHLTSEIARVFNIPESMLNADANKYNSLEQNSINFYQNTISPILNVFEKAFNNYLLSSNEKANGYYFEFDSTGIVRMTELEKIESTAKAHNEGLISFNEARARLKMTSIEDDYMRFTLGTVIKDDDGLFTIPNMGIVNNKNVLEKGDSVDRVTDNVVTEV